MAIISEDAAIFKIDNSGGSLQNVSAGVKSCIVETTVAAGTYHGLDNRWGKTIEGGILATCTLTYFNDTTTTSLAGYIREWALGATAKGGLRSIQISNPDANTGASQLDFEARLGGSIQIVNKNSGGGEPELLSITLLVDGAITESTVS